MNPIYKVSIKSFMNDINQTKDLKNKIRNLSEKEKLFIIYCNSILKNTKDRKVCEDFITKNFDKLSESIKTKLVFTDRPCPNNKLHDIIDKICSLFKLKISNQKVLQAVKGVNLESKEFNKLLENLKNFKIWHKKSSQPDRPNENINFKEFLDGNGYSYELKNLDFRIEGLTANKIRGSGKPPLWGTEIFKNINFDGITFEDCDLKYINFSFSTLTNCTFKNCDLSNFVLSNAVLKNCKFENCILNEAIFENSNFSGTQIHNCDLTYTSFCSTVLENFTVSESNMAGSCFYEAQVKEGCLLEECNLENCLLFEAKENFTIKGGIQNVITKPIILIPWSTHKPGLTATKVNMSIKQIDGIPLRYNYSPDLIDVEKLDREVVQQIELLDESPTDLSIPASILAKSAEEPDENSEIIKLKAMAAKLASKVDGIILPGGLDIQPEFYGEERGSKTVADPDYRRSIFEFALIQQTDLKGIPLMGICRGSQLVNVYYGGTLRQHVPGQSVVMQDYKVKTDQKGKGIIGGIAKTKFKGLSDHHQAIKNIARDLEQVIIHNETITVTRNGKKTIQHLAIPKALEGKRGAPKILFQFHPEFISDHSALDSKLINFLLSPENLDFMTAFISSAQTKKAKSTLLHEIKSEKIIQKTRSISEKYKINDITTSVNEGTKEQENEVHEASNDTAHSFKNNRLFRQIRNSKLIKKIAGRIFSIAFKLFKIIKKWKNIIVIYAEMGYRTLSSILSPHLRRFGKVDNLAKGRFEDNRIDKYNLLSGNESFENSEYAWHLNLGLLRNAHSLTEDRQLKKQIEFLANNYLDKSAPIRSNAMKKLISNFNTNYQTGPFSNFLYHRNDFLNKMDLGNQVNAKFAMQTKSPLILTDTDDFTHLFPLSFHVLNFGNKEQLADVITKVMTEHIKSQENDIDRACKDPLELGFLLDLTAQLNKYIKTDGNKDKEAAFESKLQECKDSVNEAINIAIERMISQNPNITNKRSELESYIRKNINPVARVKIPHMGGLKILPLFEPLQRRRLTKTHPGLVDFINHTGLFIGAMNMRRYVMQGFHLRDDIQYSVKGSNTHYYETKNDLLNTALFKRLTNKFNSKSFMELEPHLAILGSSTVGLTQGLLTDISEEKWNSLLKNEATNSILQNSLFQIQQHLAMAELNIRNFSKFTQAIELAHCELAAILELTKPYKESDFSTIYKNSLNTIPDDLQEYVKVGLGKSSTCTFAGINAAIMQTASQPARCFSKGFYYEQANLVGSNKEYEKVIADETISKVDLFACQASPNIAVSTQLKHYDHIDISSDLRKLLEEKKATDHLTVAVDCTIDFHNSEEVKELLANFKEEIKEGKLNFIFFRSGQKFDMLGMDNYFGSPFYMVNNGQAQWEPFNALIKEKIYKTDPLSLQWFCLSNRYAINQIDAYRETIFNNTKEVLQNIPKILLPDDTNDQSIRVSTMDDKMSSSFIDIKVVGMTHKERAYALLGEFYKHCSKHKIKTFRRPSFGFYHPNVTWIDGEKDSTSLRINVGLNPHENKIIIDYFNSIKKYI